ncbi:MAG: hypothetical protein MZV63_21620 [Marinilabiliales bacterium]|nr:hypothetical protein [Marinilabiliales bacterium]
MGRAFTLAERLPAADRQCSKKCVGGALVIGQSPTPIVRRELSCWKFQCRAVAGCRDRTGCHPPKVRAGRTSTRSPVPCTCASTSRRLRYRRSSKERLLALRDSRITSEGVVVIKAQRYRTRAEPPRCAGTAGGTDSQRGQGGEGAPPDQADARSKKRRLEGKTKRGAIKAGRARSTSDRPLSPASRRGSRLQRCRYVVAIGSSCAAGCSSTISASLAGAGAASTSGVSGISSSTVWLVRSIGVKWPCGSVIRSTTRRGRQNR